MVDKIISWAKKKEQQGKVLGTVIHLCYIICSNSGLQSAVHVVASCVLGAFCYKDGALNGAFLWKFGVIYGLLIGAFYLSNYYKSLRGKLVHGYEVAYSKIRRALQEESRKDSDFYNNLINKALSEIGHYYADHDVYTEACFRVCAAVEELLCEVSGGNSFRVMTFLRTTKEKDQYYINGYSPQEPMPEAYTVIFDLEDFKKLPKKDIPVHARPFLNERFEPIIHIGDAVATEYKHFNEEHPTKLHISIPCTSQGRVFAVLQITSYEDCLGDKLTIQDLIENVLTLYTSYLKVVHGHQMQHELICATLPKATQGGASNAAN